MTTKRCPCGGTMHHSSTMDDPQDAGAPFFQCQDCGEIVDAADPVNIGGTPIQPGEGFEELGRNAFRDTQLDWRHDESAACECEAEAFGVGHANYDVFRRGWLSAMENIEC